jgi:uncharacterized membrane protein/DnaJ-domain-containing protein 1
LTRFRDYYAILGVPRDATQEQIKEAYRRLVKIYHPDRNPSPEAEEMFKLINEAYQVLSDPARRAGYDVLYDAVMAEMAEASARVASETGEGVSRSGAYETYAAQETEELAEPERALITLCKAMVAYLLGSIGYEELIALTNDYVKTLKSSWGSAVRPEVRRLAMEAADLAEEREELGLMALFVKLFLAEAEPPHEKVYGAGRRRVKVAGATIVRRPSEVYNDLEKLLSSAQPGGYQEWVFATSSTETEKEVSEEHGSFETHKSYVLVELPKKVKILGGFGSFLMSPLLILIAPLPYTWVVAEGMRIRSAILQILPIVVPLWFVGFVMAMVAFRHFSRIPVTKTSTKRSLVSTAAKTFLSELLAVFLGIIIIINLPQLFFPVLILWITVGWYVIGRIVSDFYSNCGRLSDLIKSRTFRVVGNLHAWGALLSIILVGVIVLLIGYVLQGAAFFSLPSNIYISSSETAHVSQPHEQKRKSSRNL